VTDSPSRDKPVVRDVWGEGIILQRGRASHLGARGGQPSRLVHCGGSRFTHAPLLHTRTVQTVGCARAVVQATESLAPSENFRLP
jgi:hypothetical protein